MTEGQIDAAVRSRHVRPALEAPTVTINPVVSLAERFAAPQLPVRQNGPDQHQQGARIVLYYSAKSLGTRL